MWFTEASWIDKNNRFSALEVSTWFSSSFTSHWRQWTTMFFTLPLSTMGKTGKWRITTQQPVAAAPVRLYKQAGKTKKKAREREKERNEGKRALKSLTRQYSINRLDERLLMRMRTTVIIIMMLLLWFFPKKIEKKTYKRRTDICMGSRNRCN